MVRDGQIARLKTLRANRDDAAVQAALAALTEGAKGGGNRLRWRLRRRVARGRPGVRFDAMEAVAGAHTITLTPTPVSGVYGSV